MHAYVVTNMRNHVRLVHHVRRTRYIIPEEVTSETLFSIIIIWERVLITMRNYFYWQLRLKTRFFTAFIIFRNLLDFETGQNSHYGKLAELSSSINFL